MSDSQSAGESRVFLIRHGRTGLNAASRLRGRLDVPLDGVGRRQARALAQLFQDVPLRAVISSPLLRARQTALRLARSPALPLQVCPALIDRDYGSWSGHPRSEAESRYGSLEAAPGVEPWARFRVRVCEAFLAIVETAEDRPVAIVAHDAVNRAVISALVPGAAGEPDAIPQCTGCWNLLVHRSGAWDLPVLNAVPGDGRMPPPAAALPTQPAEPFP